MLYCKFMYLVCNLRTDKKRVASTATEMSILWYRSLLQGSCHAIDYGFWGVWVYSP